MYLLLSLKRQMSKLAVFMIKKTAVRTKLVLLAMQKFKTKVKILLNLKYFLNKFFFNQSCFLQKVFK